MPKYTELRGTVFWFKRRAPKPISPGSSLDLDGLLATVGKNGYVKFSLRTSSAKEAGALARKYAHLIDEAANGIGPSRKAPEASVLPSKISFPAPVLVKASELPPVEIQRSAEAMYTMLLAADEQTYKKGLQAYLLEADSSADEGDADIREPDRFSWSACDLPPVGLKGQVELLGRIMPLVNFYLNQVVHKVVEAPAAELHPFADAFRRFVDAMEKRRQSQYVPTPELKLEPDPAAEYSLKRLDGEYSRQFPSAPAVAPVAVIAPTKAASTLTIGEVWAQYKVEKIALGKQGGKKGWKDGEDVAKYDHLPHVRAFWRTLPQGEDTPIADVTFEAAIAYQSAVLAKPDESAANKVKRLMRAGALFKWAKVKRHIKDDLADAFKYPSDVPDNNYEKFSADDLRALFETPEYQDCDFSAPYEYWLPVLGLYTGGRMNELCQLRAADFSEREGVWSIAVLNEDGKRIKTAASRRLIPVHSKLVELGLLKFVRAAREQQGDGRLFPELSEAKARPGDFSKEAIRYFTAYRRACGVGAIKGRSRKVFHSFRATLIDAFRKAGVPKDRRTRLAGHDFEDTQDTNYDGGDLLDMFPIAMLRDDVEKVSFAVNFTPYAPG